MSVSSRFSELAGASAVVSLLGNRRHLQSYRAHVAADLFGNFKTDRLTVIALTALFDILIINATLSAKLLPH